MKKLAYGRLIKRSGRKAWYWHYYVGDGENRRVSTGTEDYEEALAIAKKWAAEYVAELENVIESQAVPGVALSVAITEYQLKRVPDLAPKYQGVVNGHLDRIERYFGAMTPVHEIDHKLIDGFADFLRGENPRIKPQTINAYLSTFSKLMKLCCRYGYRREMPYIEKESVIQRQHGEVYSVEQCRRILQAAREIDLERGDREDCCVRFVGLGLFCGLRHSEACAVRWDLLDFDKGIGFLEVQKNRSVMPFPLGLMGGYLAGVPKSRRVGTVVKFKYNEYSDKQREVACLRKTWNRIRQQAELAPGAKYHSLRNTFVQRHFDRYGYDAKHFSRHKSIQAMYVYLQEKNLKLLGSGENVFGEDFSGYI